MLKRLIAANYHKLSINIQSQRPLMCYQENIAMRTCSSNIILASLLIIVQLEKILMDRGIYIKNPQDIKDLFKAKILKHNIGNKPIHQWGCERICDAKCMFLGCKKEKVCDVNKKHYRSKCHLKCAEAKQAPCSFLPCRCGVEKSAGSAPRIIGGSFKRRLTKISKSRRRPLLGLGPSSGLNHFHI